MRIGALIALVSDGGFVVIIACEAFFIDLYKSNKMYI